MRDEAALTAAAQDFIGRFGAPDLVIANAGISAGTLGEAIEDIAKLRALLRTYRWETCAGVLRDAAI